jgi:hypothetical protein
MSFSLILVISVIKKTQETQYKTALRSDRTLEKLSFFNQDDDDNDNTKYQRINKTVEITLHHGDFDYLYLEYANGQRMKVLRPVTKK